MSYVSQQGATRKKADLVKFRDFIDSVIAEAHVIEAKQDNPMPLRTLPTRPLVYVAGPYRAPTEYGVRENIRRASEWSLYLWHRGFAVICPHKNTEGWGGAFGLEDQVWLDGDLVMLVRCDYVFMLPGWENSEGAKTEHAWATKLGIPIFHFENVSALLKKLPKKKLTEEV